MRRRAIWKTGLCVIGLGLGAATGEAVAEEPVDLDVVNAIRDEGMHRSQVMDTLAHLTDVIGPRLTGSPAMTEANRWTRDRLLEWGLANARLEPFPFGRGWSFSRISMHLLEPRETPLLALPKAWTPGTRGTVSGPAKRVKIETIEDLEALDEEIGGHVLLVSEPLAIEPPSGSEFQRFDDAELAETALLPIHDERDLGEFRARREKRRELLRAMNERFAAEGVLATVSVSSRANGILRVGSGGSRVPGEEVGVPAVVLGAEQYNWLARLLDAGTAVRIELAIDAEYHEGTEAFNTMAEIPGTDRRDEVVMLGAHLDSWHPGAGSNDNAAGSAVVMEAVRILQAIGVRPRRTIRVALWSGEEQGLYGSAHHVDRHYQARPAPPEDERWLGPLAWSRQWPRETKPDHGKVSAYFNLDNGSGRIRGVYTEENAAVVPIFEAWLRSFHDLGADTVSTRTTGGTDHLSFDRVGIPGFQFIQDGLDYRSRTHHTNVDTYDHALEDDLKQASMVMASFVYHAAMRDELLPRKPAPREPSSADEGDGGDED